MPLDHGPSQIVTSPQSPWTRRWRPLRSFSRESPLPRDAQDYVVVDEGVLAANIGVVDLPCRSVRPSLLVKRLQHVSIWIFETKLLISSFSKASLPNLDTIQQLGKCIQRFQSCSRNSQGSANSFKIFLKSPKLFPKIVRNLLKFLRNSLKIFRRSS